MSAPILAQGKYRILSEKSEMAAIEAASQLLEETAVNCCCWSELKLGADPLAGMS